MRAIVLAILAACAQCDEPEPPTLGAVCERLAEAACARAAACTPPLPGELDACISGYVVACCSPSCATATWTDAAAVEVCVEAYAGYSCELLPVRPPEECEAESLVGGR